MNLFYNVYFSSLGGQNHLFLHLVVFGYFGLSNTPFSTLSLVVQAFGSSKDYYIDGQNTQLIFFEKNSTRGGKRPPKLHPGSGFFGP